MDAISELVKYRLKFSALALLLVTALTLVYWNHFDNSFHFDDSHTIVNNKYITDISNLPAFFTDSEMASSLPTNQAYRPIVASLNTIDYWLAGKLDPVVFHWHIYLEFLLLLIVMYCVLARIFEAASGQRHQYVALLGTAFFAFHTATAETVNYIIARSDGFSTLMVLLSMLLFIRSEGWKKQLGLIPFMIGCLAKPTTLMLAPLLLLYCLLLESPSLTVKTEAQDYLAKILHALKSTSSFFVIGIAMFLFTRSMSPAWEPGGTSVADYLNTQPYVVWIYIKTFFIPTNLTADSDLKLIGEYFSPKVLWGLLVIALSIISAWYFSRRRITLPISFGILWFFICLTPTSTVIPLAEVMNHHRTFFPYIGLSIAVSWGGFLLFQRLAGKVPSTLAKERASLVIAVILALHAYGTYQRNEVWDSNDSLWLDTTIKSPQNGRGLMNYGLAKMKAGDMEQAIHYYERALKTSYGRHPYLYTNLGIATNALARRSDDPVLKLKAEGYLKTSLRLGPEYPATHYRYALWLHQNDRSAEALPHVERAIEISPAHKQSRELLGEIVQVVDVEVDAAAEYAKLINTPQAYLNLSLRYYQLGYYEQSIEAAELALQRRPDYKLAYNNICSANIKIKKLQKAIAACEKALELDPEYKIAQNNLRWARNEAKAGLEQP
jgi:tetratricopeptide (TPR) repeat protein